MLKPQACPIHVPIQTPVFSLSGGTLEDSYPEKLLTQEKRPIDTDTRGFPIKRLMP